MSKAVVVREFGGAEVLKLEQRDLASPGPGEVRLKHEAIGLNFIDVYNRTGLYPNPLPMVPGHEGAGVIEEIGEGVAAFKPGDRVVYSGALGAYSTERLLPAAVLNPIPDDIDMGVAAAIALKGLTACFLLTMTWPLKRDDTILFHAAAGGVGSIAVQWAKTLGLRVIGTAGSDEKIALAQENGADHVINLRTQNFAEEVKRLTDGKGVEVVFDSIGKDTFDASLDCLKPRGLMVSYGNASGPVSIPNLGVLAAKGSLFVTRPITATYFADRQVRLDAMAHLFEKVRKGELSINIGQTFQLDYIADAHRALEQRKTVGSTIIRP